MLLSKANLHSSCLLNLMDYLIIQLLPTELLVEIHSRQYLDKHHSLVHIRSHSIHYEWLLIEKTRDQDDVPLRIWNRNTWRSTDDLLLQHRQRDGCLRTPL